MLPISIGSPTTSLTYEESWLSHLDPRPGEVVLDAGSGMVRSPVPRDHGRPGGRAVGVDLSADLVERANERAASTPAWSTASVT